MSNTQQSWNDILVQKGLLDPSQASGAVQTVERIKEKIVYRDRPAPAMPSVAESVDYVPRPEDRLLMLALTNPRSRGAVLIGPRGGGKTKMVAEVCKAAKRTVVNMTATEEVDALGAWAPTTSGTFGFTATPIVDAIQNGFVVKIEEVNAWHPMKMAAFNNMLDGSGDKLYLPDGRTIDCHKDFKMVLCWNPGYAGTKPVNPALTDRLMPIHVSYLPEQSEAKIVAGQSGVSKEEAERMVSLARQIRAIRADTAFDLSPRALVTWGTIVKQLGLSWMQAFDVAVIGLVVAQFGESAPQIEVIRKLAEHDGIPEIAGDTLV